MKPSSLAPLFLLLLLILSVVLGARAVEPKRGIAFGHKLDSLSSLPIDSSFNEARMVDTLAVDSAERAPLLPYSLSSDSLLLADSLPAVADSLRAPQKGQEEPIVLEDVVDFSAQDSIVLLGQNKVFFFGKSNVSYQKMNIDANFMTINTDSSEVYARYILDADSLPTAFPTFSDGTQKFESETMRYNFRTERGFITGVLTQQADGYLSSEEGKRMPDNTMFIKGGRYTTCDNHINPHFYIQLTKAKVVPQDRIVAGPAYLVMGGVPLYFLGLPFGFFPFSETRTSGLIMPNYGEELERGFYLRGLGLYYAINDYSDVTLRTDIYTKGSWSVYAQANYVKRYKYNGNFNVGYVSSVRGDKEIPGDYSQSRDFNITWSHTQDAKVDPLRNFSASVNFSTSSYNHNSLQAMYDPNRRAENNKSSSISYSRRFTELPLNVTTALNIDQRSRDSVVSISLPNLSVSLGTVYPFKRKKRVGKERWYEKISMSYNGSLRNSITTKEDKLLHSDLLKDWSNGMQHSIPISASFNLFDYIRITPSISYSSKMYTSRVGRRYDTEAKRVVDADTVRGFYVLHDFSTSLSASTTLYGTYVPWSILGGRVQMIRHRITPSISINYKPDFADPIWGYYQKLHYTTPEGEQREEEYNLYRYGIFGSPSKGKFGGISIAMNNNLEMKLRPSASDSTQTESKKISLIDQFDWRTNYNMMADSLNWSNISASIALRFTPQFTLRLSGDFDVYLYDYTTDASGNHRPYTVNKLRLLHGKGIGRLRGTGTSFSYSFNNQSWGRVVAWYDKLLAAIGQKDELSEGNVPTDASNNTQPTPVNTPSNEPNAMRGGLREGNIQRLRGNRDGDGYIQWNYPWTFSFNYSMNLGYDLQNFDIERKEYPYKITHNLSFNGSLQPTENWYFNFNANYNFDLKKITNFNLSIRRDLHCWDLTANIIPVGFYKSYSITIGVKSQLLQALKYQQSNLDTGAKQLSWY